VIQPSSKSSSATPRHASATADVSDSWAVAVQATLKGCPANSRAPAYQSMLRCLNAHCRTGCADANSRPTLPGHCVDNADAFASAVRGAARWPKAIGQPTYQAQGNENIVKQMQRGRLEHATALTSSHTSIKGVGGNAQVPQPGQQKHRTWALQSSAHGTKRGKYVCKGPM